MNKKSQSISINTIIVAAIALAVLVVLFAIFTGRLGGFARGVQETDTCAQKCLSLNADVGKTLTEFDKNCNTGESLIGGTYKDGQYGCCCRSK
ncbi:hypothetical protein J4234_00400 [Candidatus Woesearchaeota archaeon]|nr:hypothetical protein [Candidatus Woesearchaeota archaeon]